MTNVETLQECRMAVLELNALTKQMERLAIIGGPREIGGQVLTPTSNRKTNNQTAKQMQQLDGLIEKLNKKRQENIEIIEQAETVVEHVAQRKDRVVIRCYYVEGESEREIAEKLELSQQWVNMRRNLIIDEMRKKKSLQNGKILLKW